MDSDLMRVSGAVIWLIAQAACSGGGTARGDAAVAQAPLALLVAEAPPGSPATSAWGGVLQYTLGGDGGALIAVAGIDRTLVADPMGLALRPGSSEVFVGNRHGNNAGDGVAGSISRFVWNASDHSFTPNGTIVGNGLTSVHQVAFHPVTGELFAANHTGAGGISRFLIDGQGNVTPNGHLGSGNVQGVNIAPDGKRLYLTVSTKVLRQIDLTTGTELAAVTVAPATRLDQISVRGTGELYIADEAGVVQRFRLDAADNPMLIESIQGVSIPVGVALTPDGRELLTGGHGNTDVIDRYRYDAGSDAWTPTTTQGTPASLGQMLVLQAPAP